MILTLIATGCGGASREENVQTIVGAMRQELTDEKKTDAKFFDENIAPNVSKALHQDCSDDELEVIARETEKAKNDRQKNLQISEKCKVSVTGALLSSLMKAANPDNMPKMPNVGEPEMPKFGNVKF